MLPLSGDTITIRHLGPEDPHVLERVREGTFDNPVDPSWAWRFLATGVNEIVVALQAGEVVGFASGTVIMHPDKPPQLFINEVGVHDDIARQGVATRMMNRLMDVARERGCEGIWVLTESDNAPARALYASLGGKELLGTVLYDWDMPEDQ